MDLQLAVLNAFEKIKNDGTIEAKIEETISDCISSIINETFRSYSDFGRLMKESVSKAININTSDLILPEYNQLILQVIGAEVDKHLQLQGIDRIKADLEELLAGPKEDWSLSKMVEDLKAYFEDEAREDDWNKISLHVDNSISSLRFIYFDERPNQENYSCKYRITVDNEGLVTSVSSKETDFSKAAFCGRLYGIEKKLFRLYAKKAKFIVDQDSVDVYYPSYED